MTVISLHMPKTAGTSFKTSLKTHFESRYLDDYGDVPISRSQADRLALAMSAGLAIAESGLEGIECVHGHFLPIKYSYLAEREPLTFVTWLRDPVARMFSHYRYWQESYDPLASAPHHRRVVEQSWSLERFCLSEEFRNIYSQYLWGFPLKNFAFIGISEHYAEDFGYFAEKYLAASTQPQRENVTRSVGSGDRVDAAFLDEVRNFHAADCSLYEQALQLRQARLQAERPQLRLTEYGTPAVVR